MLSDSWLCLIIGNSRLHWAWFKENNLYRSWDSDHYHQSLPNSQLPQEVVSQDIPRDIPLYLASVVPQQTQIWQEYNHHIILTLKDIPLANLYATMGVDRALAIWGAGKKYGFPCLVIDGGTALTFTGVDDQQRLIGGAILPGLDLQRKSLASKTAALPEVNWGENLPPRWASNTEGAIASGIIYTVLSSIKEFIEDWLRQFPQSQIILTGGDAEILISYLQLTYPEIGKKIIQDQQIIFLGVQYLLPLSFSCS